MNRMSEPEFAFSTAFNDVNEELKTSDINYMTSGTTCVAMYIFGFTYYIAHVGDSRAVVARRNGGSSHLLAVDLTVDHKPDARTEKARIEACGGFVGSPDEEGLSSRVYLDKECTKVGIAVARSIGDFVVKDVGVVADPDVTEHTWTTDDAFFILASDGVWEFISSQVLSIECNDHCIKSSSDERVCCVYRLQWILSQLIYPKARIMLVRS
jgi:protein phosphatase 2C family protein 2/3